jgi:hypothetical protein
MRCDRIKTACGDLIDRTVDQTHGHHAGLCDQANESRLAIAPANPCSVAAIAKQNQTTKDDSRYSQQDKMLNQMGRSGMGMGAMCAGISDKCDSNGHR